jgi:hypothetical protein
MSGNDLTEGLALMAKRFKKTVKTVKKLAEETALCSKNLAKIPFSLYATWRHLKPHLITVSGDLELHSCCGSCASLAEGESLPQFARKKTLKFRTLSYGTKKFICFLGVTIFIKPACLSADLQEW